MILYYYVILVLQWHISVVDGQLEMTLYLP